MSEWKEYSLSDIINLIGGGTPKTSVPEYWNGEIPWLSVADFNTGLKYVNNTEKYITQIGLENSSTKILKKGDIIISARGTVGVVSMLDREMAFNQSCYGIKAKKMSFNDYIYYLLNDIVNGLKQISHGGVFDTITRDTFKEIDVLLPPLSEQRAIAGVLSSLDDKIDLLHRQNKTLEAMAEALFRQWFVEGINGGKFSRITKLIDINPTRKLTKGQVAPYLEMANVSTTVFHPNDWYDREFTSGMKFINGDTLIARITPCLENGKSVYVSFLNDGQVGWGSTEYIVLHSKGNLHPFFTYTLAKSRDFRDYAEGCFEGSSGRQRVNVDHLTNYKIHIPEDSIIQEFNSIMEAVAPKLHLNFMQIRILEKLRDTLLPKLMSGDVRVVV